MRKIMVFLIGLLVATQAWAALPQNIHWRFAGWNGGGAYPMVVPDPRAAGRVYLISDVGGIWQSDEHGDRWAYKSKGLVNLKIVSLAVAPSDANVLYAATVVGIHRSINAGTDWTYLDSTKNILFIRPDNYRALAVDPANANTVVAGTKSGQVLISADGGSTWKDLGSSSYPFGQGVAVSSLAITSDSAYLFVGSVRGLKRFNFQNNVWDTPPLPAGKVYDIASYNRTIYVTYGKKVAWSATQGASWNATADISASAGEAYRLSVTVAASGAVKILVGWIDGWNGRMYLSVDGGWTWTHTGNNIHYDLAGNPTRAWKKGLTWPLSVVFDSFDPNVMYFSDHWGVFRSDDGGKNWYEKIKGAPNTIGSDIAVSDNKIYVATMDSGLLSSADQGLTFKPLIPGTAYDDTIAGHVWRVNVNGNKIVATNSPWNRAANQILVSEDGGSTFKKVQAGLPALYPKVNAVWDKGYMRALARDPADPKRYYLGIDGDDGGGFFTSLDGGYHWTRSIGQPGSLRIYNGLAVDPVEPFRIYWTALPSGSDSGGVYRTENYGTNWSQVFSGYVFDLAVAGDQTVYAAVDSSGPVLYVSTDKGATWNLLKKFPGTGTCEGIAINPANPNQIAVSVVLWNGWAPGAVYLSHDKGATWTDIGADLPYGSGASAMAFKQDGSALFIANDVGSVYCLTPVPDAIAPPKNTATVTLPAAGPSDPKAPGELTAVASGGRVDLAWKAPAKFSTYGYNIFRNGAYLKSCATTFQSDSAVLSGAVYTYTVTAYDYYGKFSKASHTATVTA